MEKLCAVVFMCVALKAVVCAPLPEIEPSPSLGEVSNQKAQVYKKMQKSVSLQASGRNTPRLFKKAV
jgi:hypothetical protein